MEIEKYVLLVKKLIDMELKSQEGDKPGVSFIVSRMIQSPYLGKMLSVLNAMDLLKIGFSVFNLYQGMDTELAIARAQTDELFFTIIVTLGYKDYHKESCDECYGGDGYIDCEECDGEGLVECHYCDGAGEIETPEGVEECDYCYGEGNNVCDYCDGEGRQECIACDGEGDIDTSDEFFERSVSMWVFRDPEVYRKLKELYETDGYLQESEMFELLDDEEIKGSFILITPTYGPSDVNENEIYDRFGSSIDNDDSYVEALGKVEDYANRIEPFDRGLRYTKEVD